MFFFRSWPASVVCLVTTYLVVYISHCASVPVVADNYLSTGLLPMISKIIKNHFSETVGLEGLFKSNCSENEIDPEKDLNSCLNTAMDIAEIVRSLRKSPEEEFTGVLSSVFKEYCRKRTKLQECFQSSYQESSQCWMDGMKKGLLKINHLTNSLSTFACSEEGDQVAQYLADGGSQCLLDKEEEIKICFNKTISAHIPTYLHATPDRQLDEEDCSDIRSLQKCALRHLEMCETPSAAIFVNNTLNTIWSSNCPHSSAPVLKRSELSGDLDDGGLLNFASGVLSIVQVVGETFWKGAVDTLNSFNTAKDASPKLDTVKGFGSSVSNATLESTRQKNENAHFSDSEEKSTHFTNLSDLVDDVEPTDKYSDVQIPVTENENRNGNSPVEETEDIETYSQVERDEWPISELGTNATDHDPKDAIKADIIVSDKQSNFDQISDFRASTTRMSVDVTTTEPPVDHASILNHTTLLVISSYVVLSLVIIVLVITLFCENILPQAD